MSLRALRTRLAHGLVPDSTGLDETASYALTFWVRINVAPAAGETYYLLGKGDILDATSQGNYGAAYRNSGGTLQLVVGHYDTVGAAEHAVIAYEFTVGRWYAVAYAYDNAAKDIETFIAARYYLGNDGASSYTSVDTTSVTAGTVPNATNTDGLYIGVGTDGTDLQNGANADLCEIALYGDAISEATLNSRLGTRLTGQEADLAVYYRLDEGPGHEAFYDRSGNGEDGTLERVSAWSDDPVDLTHSTGLVTGGVLLPVNAVHCPGTTITADSEDSSYPANNLLSPRRQQVTRTTTAAGTSYWVFALGRRQPVGAVLLLGHNLTSAATVTIEAHTSDSWGTPDLAAETITFHPGAMLHWLARLWCYDFWRLGISDTGNGDGYLELGVVGLMYPFELPLHAPGAEALAEVDTSALVRTPHGDAQVRDLDRHRTRSVSWDLLRREHGLELRRLLDLYGSGYIAAAAEPQQTGVSGLAYGHVAEMPDYAPGDAAWDYATAGALSIEEDY